MRERGQEGAFSADCPCSALGHGRGSQGTSSGHGDGGSGCFQDLMFC